jgi:alpha-1,2-glucosyltransferase
MLSFLYVRFKMSDPLKDPFGSNLPALYRPAAMTGAQLSFFVATILVFTFTVILSLPHETADEGFHTPQIWAFFSGDYRIETSLTVLPLYHAIIAGVLKAVGYFSIPFARFVHLCIACLALPVFWQICNFLRHQESDTRTLQFLLFPIILPFFSLIYTDIPALLFVLLMVLYTLKKSYYAAAAFALIAVFMRQTNLIWLGFCGILIVGEHWPHLFNRRWASFKHEFLPLFFKLLPYALTTLAAGSFFYFNGGVAVGDSHQHQISINLSNLYFFLLLSFVFFLPYNLAYTQHIFGILKDKPKVWYAIAMCFVVYMATYSNSHQYNSFGLSFYLRNVVLHYTVEFPVAKALTFLPICWSALTFYVLAAEAKVKWRIWAVYAFIAISVLPLPLVEQRYYIVAFVMFLAFKPSTHPLADRFCLFMYLPMSAALLYFISQAKLFL